MAPQLFFLALHTVWNRHPSHRFVTLGNNYMGPPEVRPGRESSLGMRGKGGRERPGSQDSLTEKSTTEKTERVLAVAKLDAD